MIDLTQLRPLPQSRSSLRTVQSIGQRLCPALASAVSICDMTPRRYARSPFTAQRTLGFTLQMQGFAWCAVLVSFMSLTACAPPASEGGLNSDNPASRLYAIRAAGEQQDRSALPALVESLDSDDPAIRMMAISALERITGTRRGYDPYASAAQRQPAVEAWVQSVRTPAPGTPGIPGTSKNPGIPAVSAPATTVTQPAKPASAERS